MISIHVVEDGRQLLTPSHLAILGRGLYVSRDAVHSVHFELPVWYFKQGVYSLGGTYFSPSHVDEREANNSAPFGFANGPWMGGTGHQTEHRMILVQGRNAQSKLLSCLARDITNERKACKDFHPTEREGAKCAGNPACCSSL